MEPLVAPLEDDDQDININPPQEMTLDDVAKVLSLTIKDDDSNKKIVFLCMLSAYTDSSQLNVSLNAPSSTGKTYLATEIAELFPDEDKVERSGASPTSFFYGGGVWNKKTNTRTVSLERKILLFYEQPNPALQEKLRALLSHDKREIKHALTNRKGNRNQTDLIILKGFPATIFCSSGMYLDEQEATRAILLSPEATEAKIMQSMELLLERWFNKNKFNSWLESQPERIALKERIKAIRREKVQEVLIAESDKAIVKGRFFKMLKTVKPRNQRDLQHLLQTIKVIALLNVWYRKKSDGTIVASHSDIDQAFDLWEAFFESQNIGIPPAVLALYKKYIVPAYIAKFKRANYDEQHAMNNSEIGLTPQELNAYYMNVENTTLNNDQLRKQILPQLQSAGMIGWEKPKQNDDKSIDRRTRHIFPKVLTEEEKKNIGIGGIDDTPPELYDQFFGSRSQDKR